MQTESRIGIRFTQRQASLITNALSFLALAVLFLLGTGCLYLALRVVAAYSTILIPPVAAIILAKVVQPIFDRFRRLLLRCAPARMRDAPETMPRSVRSLITALSIVLVLATILVPLGVFFWYFGKLVFEQVVSLVQAIPGLVRWGLERKPALREWLDARGFMPFVQALDPSGWFDASAIATEIRERAFSLAVWLYGLVGTVTGWMMTLVYMIIYLASRPLEGSDVSRVMLGVSDRTRNSVRFLIDEFIRIVVAFFRGQVLVAIIEGFLFGLGFQFLAGMPYGLTFGLLVGFVNIVPYMGSFFVMPIVGTIAYFGGDGWSTLLPVVGVWAAVGLADFYITPRIVGDRTGLGTFAVIFSLLFWGEVIGGFAGLFLAVPLSAFLAVTYRFLAREYFAHREGEDAAPAAPPSSAEDAPPAGNGAP